MIHEIENAIIERLKAATNEDAGVLGYRYDIAETYPEDWQAYWAVKPPVGDLGVWVTFGGFQSVDSTLKTARVRAQYGVLVGAKSLRNQTAARMGADSRPGSYQLVLDAIGLLHGHRVGLDISPLMLGGCQFVTLTDAQRKSCWSLLALQFSTEFGLTRSYFEPSAEFLGDFTDFEVAWEVPPHLAGAEPDLTTHVKPQQEA